ncbi:MAG: sigma-70 family RNA polymerase sigma factor [Thermoleophilia bacterium]
MTRPAATARPGSGRPLLQGRPDPDSTDDRLLLDVASGDEGAFVELRSRYRAAVAALCRRMLGADAADDCEQDAFARVWRKAALFDPGRGSATAWLLTVARNVARNAATARARVAETPVEDSVETPAPGQDAAQALAVRAALERLPAHERRALELAYYHDLSHTEIAAALDLPLGTVKSWIRRGLHRLADHVDPPGDR